MRKKKGDSNIIRINPRRPDYNAAAEKEINFIGEKLSEDRRSRHYTLIQFSKLLSEYGVSIGDAGLSKWESGRTVPSAYQLLAIAHALGIEDDLNYFIRGRADLNAEGQKKLSEYKADLIATGKYKSEPPVKRVRMIEMPVSELRASAGTGSFLDEGHFEKVKYPEALVPHGAEFGVYVSGDSMEPVYHDGQIVWVKECAELKPGEVGIFIYDGCGYIKCYDEQEPDECCVDDFTDSYGVRHMQPMLISFNEAYDPIEVSPHTSFRIVGKVL